MSKKKAYYRSIFISDIHLGSAASKLDSLLDFLDHTKCEYLYICGDFIDFLHMYEHHGWSRSCNLVMRKLLSKVKKGTKIRICIGNHDALLGILSGFQFGNIHIAHSFLHENKYIDFLVLHGDKFDKSLKFDFLSKLISFICNHFHNNFLMKYLKRKASKIIEKRIDTEKMLCFAKKEGADGVIFGHTHIPKKEAPIFNCGDWTEHCTALVEDYNGEFEILNWSKK